MASTEKPADLAAEVERLREMVLTLGEEVTALTIQHDRDRAEVKLLRDGLAIVLPGLGERVASLAAESQRHGSRISGVVKAMELAGDGDGLPGCGYDAAAAVQARRRSMHTVPAGGAR